jgi:hypothetical protein
VRPIEGDCRVGPGPFSDSTRIAVGAGHDDPFDRHGQLSFQFGHDLRKPVETLPGSPPSDGQQPDLAVRDALLRSELIGVDDVGQQCQPIGCHPALDRPADRRPRIRGDVPRVPETQSARDGPIGSPFAGAVATNRPDVSNAQRTRGTRRVQIREKVLALNDVRRIASQLANDRRQPHELERRAANPAHLHAELSDRLLPEGLPIERQHPCHGALCLERAQDVVELPLGPPLAERPGDETDSQSPDAGRSGLSGPHAALKDRPIVSRQCSSEYCCALSHAVADIDR